MAEKKEYKIRVHNVLIEVNEEIYCVYYRMSRREKYQEERDLAHGKVLYANLDDGETSGEDMIPDLEMFPVDEQAIQNVMLDKLHSCLAKLSSSEMSLIHDGFYEELTQRQLADKYGISQSAAKKRMDKLLSKLRKMMKT